MQQLFRRVNANIWVSEDGDFNVIVSVNPENGYLITRITSASNSFGNIEILKDPYKYTLVFGNAFQYATIKSNKTVKYDNVLFRVKDSSKQSVCFYNTSYKSGSYTVVTTKCIGEVTLGLNEDIVLELDSERNAVTEVALAITYLIDTFLGF